MSDEKKAWRVMINDGDEAIDMDEFFARMERWEKDRFFLVRWIDGLFPRGIAEYRATYSLTHPWEIVSYIGRHILWAWQRLVRGYDYRIYWSIDQWLSEIMVVVLPKFKEINHGTPGCMYPPDVEMGLFTDEHDKQAMDKWNSILDKMARAFELHLKQMRDSYMLTPEEKDEMKEGLDCFVEYFGALWD